jgi:hypothetical protein
MGAVADPRLSGWANFYVIVGSSAAALIGVQFVVIALIANLRRRTTVETISAPWPSLVATAAAVGLCGLAGLAYIAGVIRRARRQTTYAPVAEDWVWHSILPGIIYAALAVAALLLRRTPHVALFIVGAALLGLLVVGIHNAWDTVTYVVAGSPGDPPKADG